MKKKILAILLAVSMLVVVGCSSKDKENGTTETTGAATTSEEKLEKIKVGATATPHGEILEALKEDFKAEGLEVEVVDFDDYVMPNIALDSGDIDANFFQHKQYLEQENDEKGYDFVVAGEIHVEPMGFYSTKYKSLDELPEGAEILIPDDPTNGGRALLLLEKNGLIKLDDSTNLSATKENVAENPKNLKFTALQAVNIPSAYVDVDGAVINSNYALTVDLNPLKDSIVTEGNDSPYVNIVAVKSENKDNENIKKLVKVMTSEKCKKFIEEKYEGAVVPAF
ncbi:MetQ/NlpA family ABC transporter substrate-binding protein [Miniphocaeibacter halophilus]|uniref:MetQ/NlpA family ABC transporter substrate-binding protein n=1 Tax=Miniphocaeibacter halophilus TaxID=2931922 RepID=A0AC61MR19_9FIRM|nr:MetQ/NlpA family ABC transporter substrate-binding protein [Miniphocaeibacter halophilus]QQK08105.1 MetQ/NlpA family ABC transporter substrate-binding protein [Miniphocaeibacter halophilus]